MSFTTAGANNALTQFVDQSLDVALFDGDPSGAGTEVSGGGYARQTVTAPSWGAASAGSITATGIDFGDPTASWGSVSHYGIYSGATLLRFAALDSVITPDAATTSVTLNVTLSQSV